MEEEALAYIILFSSDAVKRALILILTCWGFFLLIDCKLSFDPNRNVTVFLVSPSSEAKNHSFFFLCSFEYMLYIYMSINIYIHIHSRYMNIYKNVYSVRKLVVRVYIRL